MKIFPFRLVFLLTCTAFISVSVFSQSPAYKNYTTADGLPSDIVYNVMQDNDGFIWLSTEMGVSRFDGRHFKNFTTADGLTHNTILKTIQDKKGRLWFLTFNGKLCYYADDKIHNPDNDTLLQKIAFTASPYLFYENATNDLWITAPNTGDVLYRLCADNTIQTYHVPPKVTIYGLWENHQGKFKAMLRTGIATLSDTGYSLERSDICKGGCGVTTAPGDSVLWVHTGDGVITTDLDGNVLRVGHPANYNFSGTDGLTVDNTGNVWLSTLNGIFQFDSNTVSPLHQHNYFTNYSFSWTCKDRENNYWFSSVGAGLFRVGSLHTHVYDYSSGLSENFVKAVAIIGDNKLLAAMHNGSIQIIDKDVVKPWRQSLVPNVGGGILVNMIKAHDGNIWILYAQQLYKYSAGQFSLLTDTVIWFKSIYEARDGTIWLGRGHGISKIVNGRIQSVCRTLVNRIYAMAEDQEGNFLLGTDKGLYRLMNKLPVPFNAGDPLLRLQIHSLAVTADSSVWIGTDNNGLMRLRHGVIKVYTNHDGLLSPRCISLLADSNHLYLLTDNGINSLEIDGETIKWGSYSVSNLFGNCEINQLLKSGPHTLLLATSRGLLQIDERELTAPSAVQPYINSFAVNDKIRQAVQTNELPYSDNNIQIEFGSIDFSPTGNANYRYMLRGLDKDWNYTTSNTVKYAALPPGDYSFLLAVRQADGRWVQQKMPLAFHIKTPWWATWWFLLAVVIALLAVVAIIIRWQLAAYKRKADQQRAFAESELKALRAQINPHFIYNALNSIQDFVLKNQREDANLYLTKFAMLMRSILSNSRKAKISLAEEIASLQLYLELETLRFNNNFSFRFITGQGIVPENIEIPSMLLQPYIENAILHGLATIEQGGLILISFNRLGNLMVCVIEDNGIGRKRSAEMHEKRRWANRPSLGMQITGERMELMNEYQEERITLKIDDLEDGNHTALGTRVTIHFPVE